MGARCINAKKKIKRRAHKQARADRLATATAQLSEARALPRRASAKS
jgi:hypothetical protein